MSLAAAFVSQLASATFENAFNPYRDVCEVHDRNGAPHLRKETLLACLSAAESSSVEALWIARDLGYRGGRRTGLALTDDVHLAAHGKRWSVDVVRATAGAPVAERTAATVWGLLSSIEQRIFLWNVFPLHPHAAGDHFTNRQHTATERAFGLAVLDDLIRMLRPKRIVCIGNDAQSALLRVAGGVPLSCVRHPSYGGTRIFETQISELYNLATPRLV